MVKRIREKYQGTKSYKEKQAIASLISSRNVMKKYRIGALTKSMLGISRRHLNGKNTTNKRKRNFE